MNCALGIHKIGFVMVSFGAVNALASITIGHIARHVKRYPIVVAGTLFNVGLLMVLLWWLPSSDDLAMFYVISGCLGLCDAIWQTQTNSKYLLEQSIWTRQSMKLRNYWKHYIVQITTEGLEREGIM